MQISMKTIQELQKKRYGYVGGVDEAGRGPLAGPVVACAVVLMPCLRQVVHNLPKARHLKQLKLKDSKQLSAKQREYYYQAFKDNPQIQWGMGRVSERMIDHINIYQATLLAMKRAVQNLSKTTPPDFLFVDGTLKIPCNIPQKAVIKGDEKIALCAMASIIAKVTRDRLMLRYHKKYPQYGFDKHKGYGTKFHFDALNRHGSSPIHRKTFKPITTIPNDQNHKSQTKAV